MDRLLTAVEVAERLGVRPSWVYAEARAGRIPHLRLGRYTRFRQDSVEAWASARERGPVVWEAPRRSDP
jgi:excisionase family DNA binding protein